MPGSWNFSDLHTTDVRGDLEFYVSLFGWRVQDMGPDAGAMITVPGHGEVLATRESTRAATARVRDPWGAEFTLSQFLAPD